MVDAPPNDPRKLAAIIVKNADKSNSVVARHIEPFLFRVRKVPVLSRLSSSPFPIVLPPVITSRGRVAFVEQPIVVIVFFLFHRNGSALSAQLAEISRQPFTASVAPFGSHSQTS
jgi:hypothetical protein